MESVGATMYTAYGSNGANIPTSVEDLIGWMVVACERKNSRCVITNHELVCLGLPQPHKVTNEQLSELSKDDAIFLLYVVNYPLLVIICNLKE